MGNVFTTLNGLNVNGHTEERNGLTYLSWAWAWAEVKKIYPEATYTIWKNENNLPYVYDPLTGYMVYTSVTIEEVTHEMWLPVMDSANNAMKAEPYSYYVKNRNFKYAKLANDGRYYDSYGNEQPEFLEKRVESATMFDVNKTIMRCLTKNLAMFGLGLYIYAGADLPEVVDDAKNVPKEAVTQTDDKVTAVEKKTAKKGKIQQEKVAPSVEAKSQDEKDKMDKRRDDFMDFIQDNFASKEEKVAVYHQVLNELKIANASEMSEDVYSKAMKRVKVLASEKAV